jgi:hypothetical protein
LHVLPERGKIEANAPLEYEPKVAPLGAHFCYTLSNQFPGGVDGVPLALRFGYQKRSALEETLYEIAHPW